MSSLGSSKKESKKERRMRVAKEIDENVERIRVAVDAFKVRGLTYVTETR